MTHLERLIKGTVEGTVVTRVSSATERIAENMAQEILSDPVFRAELQRMIRDSFGQTVRALLTPPAKNGHRKRKGRKRR